MKVYIALTVVLTLFILPISAQKKSSFSELKGPYLGQKPPGNTPEIFAQNIISTEKSELNSIFSPDGKAFYYTIHNPKPELYGNYTIWHTKVVDGKWIKPQIASFCGEYTDVDMAFSPDGSKIFFCSRRPVPGNPEPEYYVWYCNRLKDNSWSDPIMMDSPVNTPFSETYPTFTKGGRMYLASNRDGGMGSKDVYSIDYVNGKYINAVNLGDSINTQYGEGDTFIAPDESYMIISCWGRPEGKGLDISFRKEDGSWTQKVNIEKALGWETVGGCPYVTPDGKYFFFTCKGDIYWVSSSFIQKLKQN